MLARRDDVARRTAAADLGLELVDDRGGHRSHCRRNRPGTGRAVRAGLNPLMRIILISADVDQTRGRRPKPGFARRETRTRTPCSTEKGRGHAGETAGSPRADGGGGIRTHGTLARPTVFKTARFDRSRTPPTGSVCRTQPADAAGRSGRSGRSGSGDVAVSIARRSFARTSTSESSDGTSCAASPRADSSGIRHDRLRAAAY